MKLTKKDINLFLKWGYLDSDISQLQAACSEVCLTVESSSGEHRITAKEAIDILGRETFLSGIGRCAFHATCSREAPDEVTVSFDLRKWWR